MKTRTQYVAGFLSLVSAACGAAVAPTVDGGVADARFDGSSVDTGVPTDSGPVVVPSTRQLDLLMVVDNSSSMATNQSNLLSQLGSLVDQLTNPPCRSRSSPSAAAHPCDPMNPDDVRIREAIVDMHVGVVSTDLGTSGSQIPGCDDTERGDHGLLNPIRNGFALQSHLPWAPRRPNATPAPAGFRPMVCNNDVNQFPPFIKYCSNSADMTCDIPTENASTRVLTTFTDWFKCNAGLFINGCGLESHLEAAWRALHFHDARAAADNRSANAGFVRPGAVLAIVVLTDDEDSSVRNCDFDQGFSQSIGQPSCSDGRGVYNTSSMAWAHPTNPDLRFYLYQPGDARDPTWSLDRYYNTTNVPAPNRWAKDFLGLKPGHPERVVFAAITGVPLDLPRRTDGETNWDALLGAPSGSPNNFYGRDSSMAIAGMQEGSGPFSMRQANMDPNCSHVVPACRRQGSTYNPAMSCSNSQQMAFPTRRIVEVARRFDEFPACNGQPCRNGIVSSVCSSNFTIPIRTIAERIAARVGP